MQRETLVLLPGMMCDARLFGPQIEAFGDDYSIIVPPLGEFSIEAMAESVLSETQVDQFTLAGLSMGGIVAMEMVRQAPQRIQKLALLDTNHLADAPEKHAVRNRQIEDVKAGRMREVIIEEMKPAYLAEANRSSRALLDLLVDMAMDVGHEKFIAQSVALRDRQDQTETLKAFSGPALVLCGAEDNLCLPARHKQIAKLLHCAELQIVEGAGHISTLEAPLAVNDALRELLRAPVKIA